MRFIRAVFAAGDAASARLGDAVALLTALARNAVRVDVRVAASHAVREGATGWWRALIRALLAALSISPTLDPFEELRADVYKCLRHLARWGHDDMIASDDAAGARTDEAVAAAAPGVRDATMRALLFATLLRDGAADGAAGAALLEMLAASAASDKGSASLRVLALGALSALVHPRGGAPNSAAYVYFICRYISCESCSQFDSLPLTSSAQQRGVPAVLC